MATIMDVAKRAGVSMKTVSRVLNREAHVRPALKERVEAAVSALGYRPNLAARQLAGNRSFIIGYPFNNPRAAYLTDVLMGAARACRDRGYHLVSEPVDEIANALPIIERLITTLRPDGIILTPPLGDIMEVVGLVERLKVPLVRIGGGPGDYGHAILIDDYAVSMDMMAHLVAQGHSRIAFIQPPDNHSLAKARYQGYLAGLEVAGLPFDPLLVQPGAFDVDSGIVAALTLLDLPHRPTAIFAANDDMALGAFQVAHSRNLTIPGDIAIAGFDDSPASHLVWPPLTTVRQPMQRLGASAAKILLGEELDPEAVEQQLVIRQST